MPLNSSVGFLLISSVFWTFNLVLTFVLHMKRLLLIFTLGSVFLFPFCRNAQRVNVETFEKGLTGDVQLVDVRTEEEFREGHLEGALLMNIQGAYFQDEMAVLQKDKPVYIYCRSGKRSHKACEIFRKKGFKQVVELGGGIVAWEESGKEIKSQ